jgi:hypothetical protein
MFGSFNNPGAVPEGNAGPRNARACFTPAGQRVVVDRKHDLWEVVCDDHDPVRHRSLDVALIEAIRAEVEAHRAWDGIPPAQWARVIADVMVESWPRQE